MTSLFDIPDNFMPHGHCYLWKPEILWLHVVSDALIFVAYTAIPILLLLILRNNPGLRQKWVIRMFGLFILFCGLTHLVSIVTVWKPVYYLEGIVKAMTASISIVTAVLFAPVLHNILKNRGDIES